MNADIVIVDDENASLDTLVRYASLKDLSPQGFALPGDAERSLRGRSEPPLAYLVDMRIPADLGGSERLFSTVCDFGYPVDHFYFITGNISAHDEEVQARTGARILRKRSSEIFDTVDALYAHYGAR